MGNEKSTKVKIGKKAVQSTIFASINTYASIGVGLVSSVIMARILLPEHFGIVALGNFFLSLFGRIREFGFDYALIHRQENLEEAFKVHFTLQVFLGLLNLLLVLISIPFLNNYYSHEVTSVLLILGLFTLLKAASSTPRVYLEKELNFRTTTMVDIVSLILSSILGVALAFMGWGLWSLVALNVSGIAFTFCGLILFSGWKIGFSLDREILSWFLKFGFFLFIGGITTFIIFQYNDFVLGTFIGTATLGFYTKAFQFAQLPTGLVTAVVSRVALPTYAKLQTEKEKLSVAFNLVLRNIFRASAPFSLLLFLVAEDFVSFFLGNKWLPMVPVFKLLLVFSMLRPIFDDTGAFLTAVGKPQTLSKYLTVQAIVLLLLTPILVFFYKENGAAVSLNIVMVVGVILAYYYANGQVAIDYKGIFLPTTLAVTVTVVLYYLFTLLVPLASWSVLVKLVVKTLLIGISYLGAVLVLERNEIKYDVKLFLTIMKEKDG